MEATPTAQPPAFDPSKWAKPAGSTSTSAAEAAPATTAVVANTRSSTADDDQSSASASVTGSPASSSHPLQSASAAIKTKSPLSQLHEIPPGQLILPTRAATELPPPPDLEDNVWRGVISLPQVCDVRVAVSWAQGHGRAKLANLLRSPLSLPGRIKEEQVWPYLRKLSQGPRDIHVLIFRPSSSADRVAYITLFEYFHSRQRYGVVGSYNRSVKDMYLVPVTKATGIPAGLKALKVPGPKLQIEDDNMLLGVLITNSVGGSSSSHGSKSRRQAKAEGRSEEERGKVASESLPQTILDDGADSPPSVGNSPQPAANAAAQQRTTQTSAAPATADATGAAAPAPAATTHNDVAKLLNDVDVAKLLGILGSAGLGASQTSTPVASTTTTAAPAATLPTKSKRRSRWDSDDRTAAADAPAAKITTSASAAAHPPAHNAPPHHQQHPSWQSSWPQPGAQLYAPSAPPHYQRPPAPQPTSYYAPYDAAGGVPPVGHYPPPHGYYPPYAPQVPPPSSSHYYPPAPPNWPPQPQQPPRQHHR